MSDVIRIDKNLAALIKEYRNVTLDELDHKLSDSFNAESLWDRVDKDLILSRYKFGSDLDMIKDCFAKYLLFRHNIERGD